MHPADKTSGYLTLFQQIEKPVIILDGTFSIIDFNNKLCKLLHGKGENPKSLKGIKLYKLECNKIFISLYVLKAYELLEATFNESISNPYWILSRIFDSNKNLIYILISQLPIEEESNLKPITEIKKIYSEIFGQEVDENLSIVDIVNEIRYHYEYIFTHIPQSVYWKDINAVYRGGNQGLADLIGLEKPADVIGLNDFDFEKIAKWPKGTAKSFRTDDFKVIKQGIPILDREEEVFNRADGSDIYQITSKIPLKDKNNKITGVLGVATDITVIKKSKIEIEKLTKALAESNEEKRLFMFIVATRIRNILMAISTASQLLSHVDRLPEERSQALKMIDEAVDKIIQVFAHISGFIDSNKNRIEQIEIQKKIESVANEAALNVKKSPIIILADYDRNLPHFQLTDNHKVLNILNNLVRNAVKYTKSGIIKIIMKVNKMAKDFAVLDIIISDTGRGIPKERLNSLFSIFERKLEENTYQGGGFILSITKRLAEQLGGTIAVKSVVGKGTTFTFTLPIQLGEIKQTTAPKPSSIVLLKPVIISNNFHLIEALNRFILLEEVNFINSSELKLGYKHKVVLSSNTIFIDCLCGIETIKKFVNLVGPKVIKQLYFVVLINIDTNVDYASIIPENWTAVRFDMPLSPISIENQFIQEYQKWQRGQLSDIRYPVSHHKVRAFIVEDLEVARYAMKMLLKDINVRVEESDSAENALIQLKDDKWQRYDILFIDIELPGINGLELCKKIKNHLIYANVPIIAVTAFVTADDEIKCAEAGFTDVLSKPATVRSLQKIINRYVIKNFN